jgi:hypothetical protein
MTTKRYLVSVLALLACGLPAGATIATYCDNGCGANTTAAFNSAVTTDGLVYASVPDLNFTGSLTGTTQYTDGLTNIVFADSDGFGITGSLGLQASGSTDTITVSVGSQYTAVRLNIAAATSGFFFTCLDSGCNNTINLTATPQYAEYINTAMGSPWVITISAGSPDRIIIDGFDAAGMQSQADTPEIGTLLLIGTGLIVMRWMKRRPRLSFRTPQTA